MKRLLKSQWQWQAWRNRVNCRPQVETLENRLQPGQILFGGAMPLGWFASGLFAVDVSLTAAEAAARPKPSPLLQSPPSTSLTEPAMDLDLTALALTLAAQPEGSAGASEAQPPAGLATGRRAETEAPSASLGVADPANELDLFRDGIGAQPAGYLRGSQDPAEAFRAGKEVQGATPKSRAPGDHLDLNQPARPGPLVVSPPAAALDLPAVAPAQAPNLVTPTLFQGAPDGLRSQLARTPLAFEANVGQTDHRVQFLAHGGGYGLFLTGGDVVMRFQQSAAPAAALPSVPLTGIVLRMHFLGTNPAPQAIGLEQRPGRVNYLIGNDPSQWHTDIATYGRVEYHNVYDGIDVAYYGSQSQLEYDLIVHPGADPGHIALTVAGADQVSVNAQGDLQMASASHVFLQHKPFVYQEVNGQRREVAGNFVMQSPGQVGFHLGAYDTSRPLIIDPTLDALTLLGGSGADKANSVQVAQNGNVCVAGVTTSPDFPVTPGAFQFNYQGSGFDSFASVLDAPLQNLLYSTYVGGTLGTTVPYACGMDNGGRLSLAGTTTADDFPLYNGSGIGHAFLLLFNLNGDGLSFSTLDGGALDGFTGLQIRGDLAGEAGAMVYVSGASGGNTSGGPVFSEVVKFRVNSWGAQVVYRYRDVAGSFADALAVDAEGNAFVAITRFGGELFTPLNLEAYNAGALFAQIYPDGESEGPQQIGYHNAGDNAKAIVRSPADNSFYVAGALADLEGTENAFVNQYAYGGRLIRSIPLSLSSQYSSATGVVVDCQGNVDVVGSLQYASGATQAVMVQVDSSSNYSLLILTPDPDANATANAIAMSPDCWLYVAGTADPHIEPTPGAYQTVYGGGDSDAFVARVMP